MTEGIVACGGGAGNGAFDFLREAVEGAMRSPEARAALSSRGNFMEFERGTRRALRAGASSGVSALLTELDAERERLRCAGSTARAFRRAPASCRKAKGGTAARRARGKRRSWCSERAARRRQVRRGVRRRFDSAASRDTDLEPSAFARLRREARRAGFAAARVKVVLGDGAKWIWNVASELFPDAVEIVDIWHAREHLWEVARSVHGAGTALCEAWAGKACATLSEGRLDDMLAALRKHDGNDEARRCAGYVEANRARMRYPAFRAARLPVGSGEVESSCGTVAGRLRRGGMRWSVDGGANPILALRCWWLDGRYDGLFKARARPPPMALAV